MNRDRKRVLKRYDLLVSGVQDAPLRRRFEALRSAILNMNSSDWREHYAFLSDLAHDKEDLAELCGVTTKTLRNYERSVGIAPAKRGLKPNRK